MNRVLLDTDIIIHLLKKNEIFVDKFLAYYKNGSKFYFNPIVMAEVYAGAFEKERNQIDSFFNKLTNIEITEEVGLKAGLYANQFRQSHHTISLEDYLIASCTKVNNLWLWTNNKKHYPMNDINLLD